MAQSFKTGITVDDATAASSQALATNVNGDTNNRLIVDAGGKITWGSGSAAGDTTLYRSAADTLKTDDAFTAASLAVTGAFTLPTSDGSADQVIKTNGSGVLTWTDQSGGGGGSPGGSDGQVQYNNGGAFGGASSLYYDDVNSRVGIGTTSPNHSLSFGSPADGTRSLALWENGTAFYGLGNDTNRLAFYASNASGTAERMVINSDGKVGIGTTSPSTALDVSGTVTATAFSGPLTGAVTGNASTATALQTARTIGGVSFDGTANINLPGVNTVGNQDTSGNAATATKLATARTIDITGDITATAVAFDGTANIAISAAVNNDSHTHDGRYYTESESDAKYLLNTSDTLSGALTVTGNVTAQGDLYVGKDTGSDSRIYFYDDNDNVNRLLMFDTSANQFYFDSRVRLNDDLIVDDILTVGQTSLNTARRFYVYGNTLASEIRRETLSGSSGIVVFSGTGGSSRFIFYADGDAAKITGAGDWQGISDDRLKTKLTSLDGDDILTKLMALDPTMYEHTHTVNLVSDGNGDDDLEIVELDEPDPAVAGFMASDFEAQFPDLVMTKGTDNIRHLPIGQWDAILTAGLQAAVQRIEDLEARVAALEA